MSQRLEISPLVLMTLLTEFRSLHGFAKATFITADAPKEMFDELEGTDGVVNDIELLSVQVSLFGFKQIFKISYTTASGKKFSANYSMVDEMVSSSLGESASSIIFERVSDPIEITE